MNKNSEAFLKQFLEEPSPSGFEWNAAKLFRDRVKGYADEVYNDVHGNSIAVLNPKAPFKFMLAGHIDEIGLMISYIDDKGYIYTQQIGGMDPNLLVGQRVKIMTEDGFVTGVIGRKAIHNMDAEERGKPLKMTNIWVDIGAKDKKDAEKRVRIGDPMVVDVPCIKLSDDLIASRATDDKVGAFIVAEVIRALAKRKLNISVIGVATVQEEVGLRGAITSTYNVNPDAGIALDVNFASDHPDTDPKTLGDIKLGAGPNLHRGPNINPVMEKALEKTAKQLKMDYQITGDPRATGTDANAMQLVRGGAAVGLISIPNRYMHTPVEVVSLSDIDNIIKLLVEFLAKHPAKKDYRP